MDTNYDVINFFSKYFSKLCIKIQSIPVFLDVAKFADFW